MNKEKIKDIVSIALIISIFIAIFTFIWSNVTTTVSIKSRLNSHIENPLLHDNILNFLRDKYVTREEIDKRFDIFYNQVLNCKNDKD